MSRGAFGRGFSFDFIFLPDAVAAAAGVAVAQGLRGVAGRAVEERVAGGVDIVPSAAQPHGGGPFAELQRLVVDRRDDDPLLRAEAAQAPIHVERGRGLWKRLRGGVGEELLHAVEPVAGLSERAGQPVVDGVAHAGEEIERLVVGRALVVEELGGVEQILARCGVAGVQRGVERQCPQLHGEQGGGVVVEPAVEVSGRASGVLVGGRAQLEGGAPLHTGEVQRVEVDQPQVAAGRHHDILGLQVAVGPVVGEQFGGQGVEPPGELVQKRGVAAFQRPVHHDVERVALDPVVEHHVDPLALFVVGVDVELLAQELLAVYGIQIHGRLGGVAAQPVHPPVQLDAEHGGPVADGVAGPSVGIAQQPQVLQPFAESLGLFERADQAGREGIHGEKRSRGPKKAPNDLRIGVPTNGSGRSRNPRGRDRRSRRRTRRNRTSSRLWQPDPRA